MNLFVCVGTGLEPFDRLIEALDSAIDMVTAAHAGGPAHAGGHAESGTAAAAIEGVLQYGSCTRRSSYLQNVQRLSRQAFGEAMDAADVVICHAGVGTLATAVELGHVPLVMPRSLRHREVVNDHQQQITDLLAARGLVCGFAGGEELAALLQAPPQRRTPDRTKAAPLPLDIARALAKPPAQPSHRPGQRLLLRMIAAAGPSLDALRVTP